MKDGLRKERKRRDRLNPRGQKKKKEYRKKGRRKKPSLVLNINTDTNKLRNDPVTGRESDLLSEVLPFWNR